MQKIHYLHIIALILTCSVAADITFSFYKDTVSLVTDAEGEVEEDTAKEKFSLTQSLVRDPFFKDNNYRQVAIYNQLGWIAPVLDYQTPPPENV
jgi:hypothetical protein